MDLNHTLGFDDLNPMTNQAHHPNVESSDTDSPVPRLKVVVWFLTLLAAVLVVYLSPIKDELAHVRDIHARLETLGYAPELIFFLGAVVITSLGFPRMLVFPIGGFAFGFVLGLAWSIAALLVGGYVPFCYARWGGRAWICRRWPRMARLAHYFKDRSYRTVILFRILPAPGFATNAFLGITRIKHRSFLLGTALGSIPPGIPATLLGSSLLNEDSTWQIAYTTGALALFFVLWVVIPIALRDHPNIRLLKKVLMDRED